MYVVEHGGPADGPVICLVHGTLDRSATWAKVRRLLRDRQVVSYDRRGYGRSRHVQPPATGVADHVDDLLAVLGGRPALVVGHSYGGNVALAAATRPESPVRGVVAYEPPMSWLPTWPTDTAGGAAVRAAVERGDSGAAAEWFLRRMAGDTAWERLPERTKEERRAEAPTLLAELRSLREGPPYDPAAVQVPVVVGCGSRSATHHREGAQALAALLPHAERVVVEGASHGAHLTHPAEFVALVERALSSARA